MWTLYVMIDACGPWPVLWRDADPPADTPERTWRWICETEDRSEALRILEALHKKHEEGAL